MIKQSSTSTNDHTWVLSKDRCSSSRVKDEYNDLGTVSMSWVIGSWLWCCGWWFLCNYRWAAGSWFALLVDGYQHGAQLLQSRWNGSTFSMSPPIVQRSPQHKPSTAQTALGEDPSAVYKRDRPRSIFNLPWIMSRCASRPYGRQAPSSPVYMAQCPRRTMLVWKQLRFIQMAESRGALADPLVHTSILTARRMFFFEFSHVFMRVLE
jgi:hypothetical protein